MIIKRVGHYANHGTSSIELPGTWFRWDSVSASIVIEDPSGAKDFNGESSHDYTAYLSLNEIENYFKP